MVGLAHIFSHLKPFQVLLLGDFLLDTYTTGKVRRISPEAPVPIMEINRIESRPGGAGNVALNLRALSGVVTCLGRVGVDNAGKELKKLLSSHKLNTDFLLEEINHTTPVKNRLIAESQQLLRVDSETITPIPPSLEAECIQFLTKEIPRFQIVALSDYGKGFLTNKIIQVTLEIAKKSNIPVIIDPKGTDFTKYRGATIIKPNLSEAYAAAKLPSSYSLTEVAKTICAQTDIELLLITRSEAGMSLFTKQGEQRDFPVISKEVKDVTGAGDTVLAILCLALANQIDIASAVQLANIGAGIAIERLGCVQISLAELAEREQLTKLNPKTLEKLMSNLSYQAKTLV